MNARLTLGEKLKDLRTAKKLKLADVEAATGISEDDAMLALVQQSVVDEDEYLRYLFPSGSIS